MAKAKKKIAKKAAIKTRLGMRPTISRATTDIAAYLNAAFEDGDPALIAAAWRHRARQRHDGVARSAGLGRESLYKALSPGGRPELATVMKVVHALGLKLTAAHT